MNYDEQKHRQLSEEFSDILKDIFKNDQPNLIYVIRKAREMKESNLSLPDVVLNMSFADIDVIMKMNSIEI